MNEKDKQFEYRVGWSASTNVTFGGKSDWMEWGGYEETVEEVEDAIQKGASISAGLDEVFNASGFEWYALVREVTR